MKAQLALEYIGEAQDARCVLGYRIIEALGHGAGRAVVGNPRPRMPWVAEITGIDHRWGLARRFLRPNWQRKDANSTHTRGVYLWFVLESGRHYEVKHPKSWRNSDRYFCHVNGEGEVYESSSEEVIKWARSFSAPTF